MSALKKKYLEKNIQNHGVCYANKQVVQYKATSGFLFQLFIKSQVQGLQLSISELLTYLLTMTPYSITTTDGFFAKTNKAKGMNYLINKKNERMFIPENYALIQDGNSSI